MAKRVLSDRSRDGRANLAPLWRGLAAAAGALLIAAGSAFAQGGGTKATAPDELLRDYIHYVKIARYDLAASAGEEMLALKLSPIDFVKLIEGSAEYRRFTEANPLALKRAESQDAAQRIETRFNEGKLARARERGEIQRSIDNLTGTVRAKLQARERLLAAGEYAMPQLLTALLDRSSPARQAEVQAVIQGLGRQAIIPLGTALPKLDAAKQETVAHVLGTMDYRTSLPFLCDLRDSTSIDVVRQAAQRAIERIPGGPNSDATSSYYQQLAEAYYAERSEVTSFPGEEHQLLWAYDPGVPDGLVMTPVRTPVFHEAMAMRFAERALQLEADNQRTLALWIAANFKREIESPAGYANPAYPTERREAMYYAVGAGPEIAQMVVARALENRNTPLARRAIAAVEKTAGGAMLWGGGADGRAPLVEALGYPNRRVQYEAALALAAAQPAQSFSGAERVVPTLAGAIRDVATRHALVIAPTPEAYQAVRRVLEGAQFKVLPYVRTVADAAEGIAEVPAVDVVVSANIAGERVPQLLQDVRGTPRTAATPVQVLCDAESYESLRRRYAADQTISVRQSAIAEDQVSRSVEELLARAGGPITAQETRDYQVRAIAALRDLAVSGSSVLSVADAAGPLMTALGTMTGPMRLQVAEVLSRVSEARAQIALMDAAFNAGGDERVALLGKVADSAKRFGNRLEARQVTRLVETASTAKGAEATGAAALMGALNIANTGLVPVILRDAGLKQ